jgi:hypothetical protein
VNALDAAAKAMFPVMMNCLAEWQESARDQTRRGLVAFLRACAPPKDMDEASRKLWRAIVDTMLDDIGAANSRSADMGNAK